MQGRFEKFSTLTSRVRRAIRKIKVEELAEFDLKVPHLSCLYILYTKGSLTAKALSDFCVEDKGAISRSIEQLENCGLITHLCASNTKYKAPLTLTEKGREVSEKIVSKIDGVLFEAGQGINEEEREIFYRTLETISNNLEKICAKYD